MSRPSAPDAAASLERYVIPNLRNACSILQLLGQKASAGHKVADIARALELPVTTTLRIMATLQLEGLVRKTSGGFVLGPVLIHLGNAALADTEIRSAALPVLQELAAATVETAHLAIPCDGRSLIVAVQDSPHPLRAASRPGYLAELHCSSTGKVFLAFLFHDQLAELTRPPLTRRTPHTLVRAADLKREIEATIRRGYSLDNEEYHPGVRCLAAPVRSSDGSVVAAVGITAASVRFPKERIPEIGAMVVDAAQRLSSQLGYSH